MRTASIIISTLFVAGAHARPLVDANAQPNAAAHADVTPSNAQAIAKPPVNAAVHAAPAAAAANQALPAVAQAAPAQRIKAAAILANVDVDLCERLGHNTEAAKQCRASGGGERTTGTDAHGLDINLNGVNKVANVKAVTTPLSLISDEDDQACDQRLHDLQMRLDAALGRTKQLESANKLLLEQKNKAAAHKDEAGAENTFAPKQRTKAVTPPGQTAADRVGSKLSSTLPICSAKQLKLKDTLNCIIEPIVAEVTGQHDTASDVQSKEGNIVKDTAQKEESHAENGAQGVIGIPPKVAASLKSFGSDVKVDAAEQKAAGAAKAAAADKANRAQQAKGGVEDKEQTTKATIADKAGNVQQAKLSL